MDHHNRFQNGTPMEFQAERHGSESILETVLRGLAAVKDVPVTDLDPLYEQINPDALINFHRHAKEADTAVSIEFTVDEYTVTISQTDNVCISDRTST